jgi:hypothetical protein
LAGTGKKWLIGCGVGCGTLMTRPMNRAVESQKELTSRFGERDAYTPPARLDGSRIEAFLEVRREVMASCEEFKEITDSFRAMDELDQGGDDPSVGEVLGGLKGVMGAAFGMAGAMGDVTHLRNEALARHRMGLGEYTWIYILSYNSMLGISPNTGIDSAEGHGYRGRKLNLITDMMDRHANALDREDEPALAELWRQEAESLRRRDQGVPFADSTVPSDFQEVAAPYRSRLKKHYCPEMADFDLNFIKKKGMSYHAN